MSQEIPMIGRAEVAALSVVAVVSLAIVAAAAGLVLGAAYRVLVWWLMTA